MTMITTLVARNYTMDMQDTLFIKMLPPVTSAKQHKRLRSLVCCLVCPTMPLQRIILGICATWSDPRMLQQIVRGITKENWELTYNQIMEPLCLKSRIHVLNLVRSHKPCSLHRLCQPWKSVVLSTVHQGKEMKLKFRELTLNSCRVITGSRNFPREHQDSLSYKPSWKFLEIRFLLLAVWWAKAVVLDVWFLEQHHQHHLGTC